MDSHTVTNYSARVSDTKYNAEVSTSVKFLLFFWCIAAGQCLTNIYHKNGDCSQIEAHGDLQEVLINVSLTQPSDTCVQVNIAPGSYVISRTLNISRNVVLQAVGEGVIVSFSMAAYQAGPPLYVMQFANVDFAALDGIHFTNSSGIVGFENVTQVLINNCTFSYFVEGAVDIYNSGYPTITNCTFQHNGPASVIKQQPYRGHSGGLSIGLSLNHSLGFNPEVHVSNCRFISNSAIVGASLVQTSSNAIQRLILTGRGGGAAILVNTSDPVYVSVEDCVFVDNSATSFGGGLYLLPDGPSNNTFVVNRTVFIQNRGGGGSGALHLAFRDIGTLTRLHSYLVYNSEFVENVGSIGGAIYVSIIGIPSGNGEIGDYVYLKNCTFIKNEATLFGGALAASTVVILASREKIKALDIRDCTFISNRILNSVGGVFGIAYFSVNFLGVNIFSENVGSSISLAGSVMTIISGGSLQFINNTNIGHVGGALYVSSFGQVILKDSIKIKFDGNSGSFGAAIVTDGYIPSTLQHTAKNSLCFVQHPGAYPLEWASHNVSFVFHNNKASVGSSVYMSNVGACSSSDSTGSTAQIFGLNFAEYQQNVNYDYHGDINNPQWNVQTPPIFMQVQNRSLNMSAYAGSKFKIYIAVISEFGYPVSAVLRLSDSQARSTSRHTYIFPKSLILYSNLSEQDFESEFLVLHEISDQHDIQITTVDTYAQYQSTFQISQQACPAGFVLALQNSGYQSCMCNALNPAIANCSDTTVQFTIDSGGLWANASNYVNEYGDTMATYPCPLGYCHCIISEQADGIVCLFSVDSTSVNSQCDCQRTGVLCGNCADGLGVSALLNECVTCSDASGLLIAGLIVGDVIAFILLVMMGISIPSWLQPCVFYLQLLPYVTEHFPVTFSAVHHYLYYVSSGLSFYFVYDFCLYSNMSPLVSYFIRYLPLFTAIIICPIALAIRKKIYPCGHAPWHGLWWIVVLMYTHVVHTSMSILNCPRLPGSDGNTANVWYINGNIECFTGWHIPLAILAMLVLIICVAAIPLAASAKMVPKWADEYLHNIDPTLRVNYRDELEWFGALDLLRRMIFVLLIVAFPSSEHPSIFLIATIMSIYGYIKPYKHMVSNILEVALAADLLIMLLIKNTDQFELLQVLPGYVNVNELQGINNTSTCTDTEDILGLTPLVEMLTPFYYTPLVTTLMGAVLWFSASWYKRQKNNKRVLSKPDVNTVVSGDLEILDWNQTGIAEVSYVLLSNEALD